MKTEQGTFFQISRGADIESSSNLLRLVFVNRSKIFSAQNTRTERLVGSDLDGPVKCEPNSVESATGVRPNFESIGSYAMLFGTLT